MINLPLESRDEVSWMMLGLLGVLGVLGAACGPIAGPGAEGGEGSTSTGTSEPTGPTASTASTEPTEPTEPTTSTTEPKPACESDDDCGSWYCGYCVNGECVESPGCCGGYGARTPAHAQGWECSPPYECYEDWDCFDGEVCVGGSCGLAPALKLPRCEPQNFVTSEWNLSAAPSAFVLADLDGDLDLDLAAGQPASGQIEVALNDGAGTFVLAGAFPVGPPDSALWLVAADFDLDGDVDLAAALPGGGLVLAFGQDAVFMAAPPLAIGSLPEQLIVTDINGDAAPDLVMLYADNPQVTTWINDGKGGFGPEVSVLIEGPVHSQAAIVDITGDGVPDLLAPFEGNFVGVGLWSGAVDGVFLGQEAFDTPLAVTAVYATHLAPMDARSVIAVRPSESGGVAQVWGPGPEPWLAKPTLYGGSVALRGGVMAEFEGSLGPDLISATAGPTIAVWAGDGAGGFACERKITVPAPTVGTLMAVGDVDGDGRADILLGREDSNTVTLLRRP